MADDKLAIGLDEGEMKTIVAKYILDKLSPEKRDELLAKTLVHLIEPTVTDSLGRRTTGPSFLENAFVVAAEQALRTIVFDMMKTNETFTAELRKLVAEAMEQAVMRDAAGNYTLRSAVTSAIVRALEENVVIRPV